MIKKFSYIFDRGQKIRLLILLGIIIFGTFVELLGVSAILPLVNVVVDPSSISTNRLFILINKFFVISNERVFIVILALGLVLIYIIKNLYLTLMYNLQYRYTYNNQRRLAMKLMKCYMNQDYLFHVNKNVAELQRNVTTDINQFFSTVLNLLQLISELSVCIILVIYLMFTDVLVTLGVTSLISIFLILFILFFKKNLYNLGAKNRVLNFEMSKWLLQSFGGIKEIKVLNKEVFFLDNYDKCYKQYAETQRKQLLYGILPRPIMETICIGGLLIIMSMKIYLGADMTTFIPILSVFAISAFRMLPSFNRIAGYMNSIMYNKPSVDAVYRDLKEIEDLLNNKEKNQYFNDKIELGNNNIILSGLSFSYPNTDKIVLEKINLEIPKNSSVALIGASGSGKTTLADIILGILDPQEGVIQYGNYNIFKYLDKWHSIVGYIPQSIYLIDDSIKANIAFGVPEEEVNIDQILRAIKEAQLDDFIVNLENGINTQIGERGVKLSGGQRQRIGIARALYNNPQILILDEATSALDNETETAVMEAIDSLHGSRTMIVIAHRLTTIRNCDFIYEVNNSQLILKDKSKIFGDNL